MERDHNPEPTQLTGIHINLAEQAIEFEDRHGTVGRLRFTGETVLYEGQPLLLKPTPDTGPAPEQAAAPLPDQPPRPMQPLRPSRNSSPPASRSPF